MSTESIPQTDSIEELSRFWDTHDLTHFEEELEEVTAPGFERETVSKSTCDRNKPRPSRPSLTPKDSDTPT